MKHHGSGHESKSVRLLGHSVAVPSWVELPLPPSGDPIDFAVEVGRPNGPAASFPIDDAVVLHVQHDERSVLVEPLLRPSDGTVGPRALEHYLIDHAAPTAVCEFGGIALHCGAVAMGQRCVLLLGASGAGKSTAVGLLEAMGWRPLGDDSVSVRSVGNCWTVLPSYAGIRLHASSIERTGLGDRVRSSLVAEYADKVRTTSSRPTMWTGDGAVLEGIVVLGHDARFSVRELGAGERCARLADQLFLAPGPARDAIRRLERVTPIAASVWGSTVDYPRSARGVEALGQYLREAIGP